MKKILFLNLKAFSFTGGIEKFNRAFLKALTDLEKENKLEANSYSIYDDKSDIRYFNQKNYKGFKGNKILFTISVILSAYKYNTIILSHINLSLAAWVIKKVFHSKQIILVTHGIEVWRPLSAIQKAVLQKADKILAVSAFTKQKIIEIHGISPDKITIFHNTIDPYFAYPSQFEKPKYLLDRYGLHETDPVIFTLTRLTSSEKNKGYDHIINVLPPLVKKFPQVKYLLSGKYDESEKSRIDILKKNNGVTETVIVTGFVKDEEVTDHYLLADVFILPSRKEGFGIVFIEAMACGLAVIGGNKDGSADALQNGDLGLLVDPENETEILHALEETLFANSRLTDTRAAEKLQQKVLHIFGFETFKQNLQKVLA